jgi:hypothetical protein
MLPLAHSPLRLACALLLGLSSATLPSSAQSTWYVDVNHPGPGQGTQGNPYASLQHAIDQPSTVTGDTLLVAPGTYVENVSYGSKGVILVGTAGPAATVIRAAAPGPVVTLPVSVGAITQFPRIEGFTIVGAMGPGAVGIVQPIDGFSLIRRVVVRDCDGPGVVNDYDMILEQTTLTGNKVGLKNGGLGVLWSPTRLVVWGNAVETENLIYFGGHAVTHSIIPPIGNVDLQTTLYVDPLFWDEAKGDVHLQAASPAIHFGTDWGALEFDPGYVPNVKQECVTAPNSAGPGALIDWSGSASISGADLTLLVGGAPPGRLGLFYYGPESAQVPFGDGFRCVGGGTLGVFRLPPLFTTAGGSGQTALDFDAPPVGAGPGAVSPGSSWTFQFFYRDPTGPLGTGFNLSDALRVAFTP